MLYKQEKNKGRLLGCYLFDALFGCERTSRVHSWAYISCNSGRCVVLGLRSLLYSNYSKIELGDYIVIEITPVRCLS